MTHGMDTGFLTAAEVHEHPDYAAARTTLSRLVAAGDRVAIAPRVLAEFIHVATDPRRFIHPLDVPTARQIAEQWWTAREVERTFPDEVATWRFLTWHGNTRWVGSGCWTRSWRPPMPKPAFARC